VSGNSGSNDGLLICIPNHEVFMSVCDQFDSKDSTAYLTADEKVAQELTGKGFKNIIQLKEEELFVDLKQKFMKVILLEDRLADTCSLSKVIQISTFAPIIVVTKNKMYPQKLYECLGVKHVIYTNCNNIAYLIH
jgi:hypothetical protein